MQIPAISSALTAAKPAEPAAVAPQDEAKLGAASQQFEAILLRQFLSESMKPLLEGGPSGQVYGYLLTDTLADSLSKGGGLGLSSVIQAQLGKGGAVSAIPMFADEIVEQKELLVDLLRSEIEEYGGLLALLEDQQNAIVARESEHVLEINTAINDQMRMIQMRRQTREEFVSEMIVTLQQRPSCTLREMIRFFRKPLQPLVEALIDEINSLVQRARRRAQQNQMLLARSIEVMQEVLHRLNPETMHRVYGADGRSLFGVREVGSRWVVHT